MKCKTVFEKKVIDSDVSDWLFNTLLEEVKWEDGIRSKRGFTRKAKKLGIQDEMFMFLIPYIETCLNKLTTVKYGILGIYLNLYEDGNMWTPNHSHKGTHQLVLSLGGKRTLTVGKKSFEMDSGDAVIFGSTVHGVPRVNKSEPRISVATFMVPV